MNILQKNWIKIEKYTKIIKEENLQSQNMIQVMTNEYNQIKLS